MLLKGDAAEKALSAFAAGKADLVLGGTFADVPLAQRTNVAASALQFDPASGLFGLVPLRKDGPAGDADVRASARPRARPRCTDAPPSPFAG